LALNVSAEILNAFRTVNESLDKSNKVIEKNSRDIYASLEAKAHDQKYASTAVKWVPLAQKAQVYSKTMNDLIDTLKMKLLVEAGFDPIKNGDSSYKEENLDAATRLFDTKGEGPKLLAALTQYKSDMLSIDPEISQKFSATLPIDLRIPTSKSGNSNMTWTTAYFHMTPAVAALTMLSKFQNDVKNSENQIVAYCHSKIGQVEVIYDQFKPIVGTSSTYLMPGEDMTITAGIGSFSKAANPTITINGVTKQADEDGVATNTFKVAGSGTVHVKIDYTKPDGTKGSVDKDIQYTVGQASTAAISLDKMNVFYVGLDNPITIGSPTGMERTSVTGRGCTVNGSGPHRTVTVSTPGECSITVTPQGSAPLTENFRIKRIPEPEFKIGTGKPRMPSVEFKNQQYCRADMGADFIYDVRYNVNSATVYFSGANFPNVVTTSISGNNLGPLEQYVSRCGPGSVVSFDNIKVTGPDGTRIIEGKSFALY
jgi:gliding motility-associated protein GldM